MISWICITQKILDKNHYGLLSVKKEFLVFIINYFNYAKRFNGRSDRAPILCLIGLVGTGKTTLAYSIAEALGRKFERIPFGGMGMQGQFVVNLGHMLMQSRAQLLKIAHSQSKNPVILLDELIG